MIIIDAQNILELNIGLFMKVYDLGHKLTIKIAVKVTLKRFQ